MKKSIVGSVDGLCDEAIAKKLLTRAEKAQIFVDNNTYRQASRFLDNLALKIEVEPVDLALLMNMLSGLGLRTCDQIVLRISECGGWVLDMQWKELDLMVVTFVCRGNLGERKLRCSFNKFIWQDLPTRCTDYNSIIIIFFCRTHERFLSVFFPIIWTLHTLLHMHYSFLVHALVFHFVARLYCLMW